LKSQFETSKNQRGGKVKLLGTGGVFKVIFERLDSIEDVIDTKLPKRKKKIGL